MSSAQGQPVFWLHIKKSAGQSVRAALGDAYQETNRSRPSVFLALPRTEWNDNLNNYRVPLGDYDYRRMLFAKRFLFDSEATFERTFKFAVVRNPYARAVSCWRYLYSRHPRLWRRARTYLSFEYFLRSLPEIWETRSNRHIATHTAPIWPDITDESGQVLLDYTARLEQLDRDFSEIASRVGLATRRLPHRNHRGGGADYRRRYTRKTRALVEELYGQDIERLGYDF